MPRYLQFIGRFVINEKLHLANERLNCRPPNGKPSLISYFKTRYNKLIYTNLILGSGELKHLSNYLKKSTEILLVVVSERELGLYELLIFTGKLIVIIFFIAFAAGEGIKSCTVELLL